jgi:hypothetical protein
MSEKVVKNTGNSVDLHAIHARVKAGEITKKAAAAELGWSYPRLCVALGRAGLLDDIRTPRGAARYDTEAMKKGLEEALCTREKTSLAQIARRHGIPDTQYAAFAMRVLHIKRSRMKADLSNDEKGHSGAAAGG